MKNYNGYDKMNKEETTKKEDAFLSNLTKEKTKQQTAFPIFIPQGVRVLLH